MKNVTHQSKNDKCEDCVYFMKHIQNLHNKNYYCSKLDKYVSKDYTCEEYNRGVYNL